MSVVPIAAAIALLAQPPRALASWGTLEPGPHPVGFGQRWVIDSTRRLPEGAARGPRYRPILLNLWYPAAERSAARMPYRGYFDGPLAGPAPGSALAEYAAALAAYTRDLAVRELAGVPLDSAPAQLRQRVESFLASPTAVRRDAPMQPGRRPVVVYLQGARAPYDDNVALCEYLASRGYLVVGSAFPREDNTDFGTTVRDESRQRDLRRLLLEVMRLPGVVPGPVVVVGHSAGAQAMLLLATDPTAPIDAVLALDTTQDYALLADRTWAYFTDRVVERREAVRTPVVFVAGPEGLFELGDSLRAARRWFVTAPDLLHSDFVSRGVVRRELALGLPGGDSLAAARARRTYDALARYLAAWLDAFVADTAAGAGPVAPPPLRVEHALPGAPVHTPGGSGPASARTLRHLFTTGRESEFADAFLAARRDGLDAGSDGVLTMLLTGAIAGGRRELAAATFARLLERDPSVRGVLARIADRQRLFERIRAPDLAKVWQDYLTVLDPTGASGTARPRP